MSDYKFNISAARKNPSFIKAFLVTVTIRKNQKVASIDGHHWPLVFDSKLHDAFNKGFVSVMCIVSCQLHNVGNRQIRVAVAKPHFYSAYNTALHHTYNGRAMQ